MNSDLLTTLETASYLKVAKQTLAVWRLSGRGPEFLRIGRKIVYRRATLDDFLVARTYSSTAEY